MADFEAALALLLRHEGGYANDPIDRGGETYRGIARRIHPDWSGWKRIDAAKRRAGFPRSLAADAALRKAVAAFYRRYYWGPLRGARIGDQALAAELLDSAANLGVRRAGRLLQEALNLLNRNQKNYADLVVDGWVGPKTLAALEALLAVDRGAHHLLRLLNALQAAHYIELLRRDPSQERFARGWLART